MQFSLAYLMIVNWLTNATIIYYLVASITCKILNRHLVTRLKVSKGVWKLSKKIVHFESQNAKKCEIYCVSCKNIGRLFATQFRQFRHNNISLFLEGRCLPLKFSAVRLFIHLFCYLLHFKQHNS